MVVVSGLMMMGLWISCGDKTKAGVATADSTATTTDSMAATVIDKHSEAYIRQRVDTIYSYVDQGLVDPDSIFCSQRYYTLLQQASQHSEKTGFVYQDYDHWIMGQDRSSEWTYDTKKIENITDSTAEVEMDIRNFGKHNYVTLKLRYERGDWFVDDFVSYSGHETGEQNEYSEVKTMEKFINDLQEVHEKGRVFTGYWGWVYEDTPELLLRLVMTDQGLECTECTIYRLHSYHNVKTSFDGDYLYLEDFSEEAGKIRLKLKLDDIGDLTGEAYVEHRYLKDSFEGTITLRKDFFYYRDMPQRKPLSDYAE